MAEIIAEPVSKSIAGIGSLIILQESDEFNDSPCTVADLVFFGYRHLGKGSVKPEGLKNGVVSKAFSAFFMVGDDAFYDAFEVVKLLQACQGDYGFEAGPSVCYAIEVLQQQGDVVVAVSLEPGIAGGIYAGSLPKGFYFQAGVIGKAGDVEFLKNVFCFLPGVAFNGRLGFGKFFGAADLVKA
jgi:hypothetical protein